MKPNRLIQLPVMLLTLFHFISAQPVQAQNTKRDTTKIVTNEDRNVMLNAANSTGPRDVNVGLPASVGGTTILENGLPAVYYWWPAFPSKVWRQDAMIDHTELLDLGKTALTTGDVGFSLSTYDNLGTDKHQRNVSLMSNHFGLLNGTANISGPIGKNGLEFSIGAYINYDPGAYKVPFEKYYVDKTQLYKAALTQHYRNGKISVFYKYMNYKGMQSSASPFIYKKNGKVKALDGIKIGGTNFYEASGKIWVKDPFDPSKPLKEKDVFDDFGTESHTFDVIGSNNLPNNWNLDYTLRYSHVKSRLYYFSPVDAISVGVGEYQYLDGSPYNGDAIYRTWNTTTPEMKNTYLAGVFNLSKKTYNHKLNLGLMEQYFDQGTFAASITSYYMGITKDPQIVIPTKPNSDFDKHGNIISSYNADGEYDNGWTNKLALYASDEWDITDRLKLNYGARLEWHKLKGDYAPVTDTRNPRIYNESSGSYIDRSQLTSFCNNTLNLAANVNAVYKLTKNFGLLGELSFNRQSLHLENYAGNLEIDPKQSNIPNGGIGVYYNHPMISLVSKATYIQKDNYINRTTFSLTGADPVSKVVFYDIETLGWTTDLLFTPFGSEGFNLHLLVTIQEPKYKGYSGNVLFNNGQDLKYDFNGKTATTVSKILLEIDPSYTFKLNKETTVKTWLSARYFGKQYANLPNTLYYAARWETFGGVNVSYKNLDIYGNVINILNQSGANGTIGGTDLVSQEEANKKIGTILASSYIRPFVVEFGLKYRF